MGNDTCPYPNLTEAEQPIIGGYTFHQLNLVISAAFGAFAILSTLLLMFLHATHLSKYNEQAKIMKILALIPWYTILSYLSIAYPTAYVYLDPWTEYVQAIALASFFLLMCEFVSPFHEQRSVFFSALELKSKRSGKSMKSGLQWYRRMWILIFQYPVVTFLIAIATAATQATGNYCLWNSNVHYAHLWLNIAANISVAVAVLTVLRMYKELRTQLAHHKPLAKLLAFKLIVFLTFVQGIVFWIIRDKNLITLTDDFKYADLYIGVPELLICIEMALFSIFFHYAYSYRPYVVRDKTGDAPTYQGGFLGWRLFVSILDPREVANAIVFSFKMYIEYKNNKEEEVTPYGSNVRLNQPAHYGGNAPMNQPAQYQGNAPVNQPAQYGGNVSMNQPAQYGANARLN